MAIEDLLSCLSMGAVAGLGIGLALNFTISAVFKVINSVINS